MMPTAAPQQTALEPVELPAGSRLRRLLGELARRQVLARTRSPKMKQTPFARAYAAARGSLAVFGLAALIGVAALPLQGFQYLRHFAAEPFSIPATTTAGPIQASMVESAGEREQRALAEFIAKRWRIADSASTSFVSIAYRAGAAHNVDPVLILAVMAVESRYNPVAESDMGAKGLMQVIPKFHLEKLMDHGGEAALLDPEVNIHVGAQIIREYYRRFGEIETALQMYAGAFDEPTAQYAHKVLGEKARLEVLRQKARKEQNV
jgi:soluble lytic murein transglycosylase-like protein